MEELGHLVTGLEHFVRDYGVVAVMVILALEALGAPLPGETLLIFASILAGRGEMSLPALLIFAWAGAVMGAGGRSSLRSRRRSRLRWPGRARPRGRL